MKVAGLWPQKPTAIITRIKKSLSREISLIDNTSLFASVSQNSFKVKIAFCVPFQYCILRGRKLNKTCNEH